MGTELLQFAGAGVVFGIVVLLWLRIVYLPARTMERWEGRRLGRGRGDESPRQPEL